MVEVAIIGIDPAKPVHPGDTVTGTVQLLLSAKDKPIAVQEIRSAIEGRCKVRRTEKERRGNTYVDVNYISDIQLYRTSKVVFSGPETWSTTQNWDFALKVPKKVTPTNPRRPRLRKHHLPLFDVSRTQATPPSMDATSKRNLGEVRCYINHTLQVQLLVPALGVIRACSISIPVVPYREIQTPIPKMITYTEPRTVASLHLDPQIGNRKLTMGERLKGKLQSDADLPKLDYVIDIEVPDSVIASEEIPIFLSARSKDRNSSQELPPIELKQCAIHIARKITATSPDTDETDAVETFEVGVSLGNWDGKIEASYPGGANRPPVLLNNRIELAQLTKRPISLRGKTFSLAFKTFNISERHYIVVIGTIEVAKKLDRIGLQSKAITIFSPYYRPPRLDKQSLEE